MTDFERVKAELNIKDIILKETGLSMKGTHLSECPLCHHKGCFSFPPAGGTFKCRSCDSGGDIFEFLQKYHSTDKIGALKMGADLAGIKLETRGPSKKAVHETVNQRIFMAAAEYYHENLKENKAASDYLINKRGHKPETIEYLRVGWTTGKLHEYLKEKGFSSDDMVQSGLVGENTDKDGKHLNHYDFFPEGVAIFPHVIKGKVGHFTIKDPQKKAKHQLPNTVKDSAWTFYNQEAMKGTETILVEGEHDLLSLVDAGFKNVAALIGQISDKQLKSLATIMKDKKLYVWFDKDESGNNYIRKIKNKLKGDAYFLRIIEHPGEHNDADLYLQNFSDDMRKEVRKLIESAASYLDWEITRISHAVTADEQSQQLKAHKVFSQISIMDSMNQEIYIEKLLKLKFDRKTIESQLDKNQDLKELLAIYYENEKEKEYDPLSIARIIFSYYNEFGRFFHDGQTSTYLLYQHTILKIGDNLKFNALMMKSTNLIINKTPGPQVWRVLENLSYNEGLHIELASWIKVNRVTDSIFVNLNSPGNDILKISPGSIEAIENGLNDEGVLLNSSDKIRPFKYLPEVDIREGMTKISELIVSNMTCEEEQRHLILCWLMTAFMIDFSPYMALMKFSGASESGKTTAAKLLSLLLYGDEQLIDPSGAAAFSISAQNPLLIIDNLEQENITKQIGQFLLLSSTRGSKEKRTTGTETGTTQEKPSSLVLITAIEPFTKAEHINRTFDVGFSRKYWTDGFIEDEIIREIIKNRDLMLSAILKLIATEILPNLSDRKDHLIVLRKEYPKHSKSRTNEYLALMMLILTKIIKHVPVYGEGDFLSDAEASSDVWGKWIEYQDRKAKETETGSNIIIKLLEGISRGVLLKFRAISEKEYIDIGVTPIPREESGEDIVRELEDNELGLTFYMSKDKVIKEDNESYSEASIFFVATSAEVVYALDAHCKDKQITNPFKNAITFSARLKNDLRVLAKSGWTFITNGDGPYLKKVRGDRYYCFRKRVTR